jgi:hypothetical protein
MIFAPFQLFQLLPITALAALWRHARSGVQGGD